MTLPTPRQFSASLDASRRRIFNHLDTLAQTYEKAYGASLDRVVREQGGKIISGGVSDPTASITGDPLDPKRPGAQAAIRRTLERAPKRLTDAENTLGAIERDIERAMDRLDPREGFEALRYPISVSRAELEESHAAQERRRVAGEE